MKKTFLFRLLRTITSLIILSIFLSAFAFTGMTTAAAQDSNPPEEPLAPPAQALNPDEIIIYYHPDTGTARFVAAPPGQSIRQPRATSPGAAPQEAAMGFLSAYGGLFGLRDADRELGTKEEIPTERGRSVVRFQQQYQGIPVFAGEMIVNLDSARNVLSASGEILPDVNIDIAPAISAENAQAAALAFTAQKYQAPENELETSDAQIMVYNPTLIGATPGSTQLVWQVVVSAKSLQPIRELVLIDAQAGKPALSYNQVDSALNRQTYTLNHGTSLPGTLVCNESNPTCSNGDTDAKNAHKFASDTYNFYYGIHGRDSIDNAGMTLRSSVHYGTNYLNAFWNGVQMTYGDSMVADDVVGHELTHGVTEYTSNLIYMNQSGAINESFSDLWGEFVDLTNGSGNDGASVRWMMGEDLPSSIGVIRNMANPTQFGDPDRMGSPYYYTGSGDNGGVHFNSGVNNKAAYLMTDGDTFNGYTVTGIGIEKVARIYYEVQTHQLTSGSDYNDLGIALVNACNLLTGSHGITSEDCTQVNNAVMATEMNLPGPSQPEPPANDDFDQATVIDGTEHIVFTDSLNVAGATTANDDPPILYGLPFYRSIWYQFTPSEPGSILLDTTGSSYDTILGLWRGNRGNLQSIAINDDINYDAYNYQSQINVQLNGGTPYWIEVASWNYNSTYNLNFSLEFTPGGSNSPIVGTYDDADPSFVYTGYWDTSCPKGICSTARNGTLHISNKRKNTANLSFTGDQVIVYYMAVRGYGTLQVLVDGIQVGRISQNAGRVPDPREFRWSGLGDGSHTLTLKHLSGKKVNVDGVESFSATQVAADGELFEDDATTYLSYRGHWQLEQAVVPYSTSGTSITRSLKKNDTTAFTFNGSEYCTRFWSYRGSGKVTIYLDNIKVTTINLSSRSRTPAERWYRSSVIPAGDHTVLLKNTSKLPITFDQVVIGNDCSIQ